MAKIKITQAKSAVGNEYLIYQFKDANTLPSFEIYKLIKNCKEVAREFGVNQTQIGRKDDLNTREMCLKMMDKINTDNLYSDLN